MFKLCRASTPQPRRPHSQTWLLAGLLFVLGLGFAPVAEACKGHPPPPSCGKTLVISQGAPPVVLLPGGGTFDIPVTVYFRMTGFPSGTNICPIGPFTVDVDMTVTCSPSADGTGSISAATLVQGYNDFLIPVTLPAGPSRVCQVDGVATVLLSDGMELTATNDSLVCIAEPAPGNPALPRLDFELFGDPDDVIQNHHPGDQGVFTYRITNNDPVETYTGQLAVESVNSSRLPGMSGPAPPGTGVFPISDPGLGDNFPIRLPHELINGCVPLPLEPQLPIVPTILEPLVIPPGEFFEFDIFTRSWGMCADGSCSRAKLLVDGDFSGGDSGLACSGFVHAADTSVPPQYLWPDSGEVTQFPLPVNPAQGQLTFVGQPAPGLPMQIDAQIQQPQLFVGGKPIPLPPQLEAGFFEPELGRIAAQWQDPQGVLLPTDPFQMMLHMDLFPSPGNMFETQLMHLDLVGGAPTGFEDIAPFAMGRLGILLPGGDPDFDAFLDFTLQLSGQATDENGERRDLIFDQVNIALSGNGVGLDIQLQGTIAPGSGKQIPLLQIYQDLTGFLTQGITPFLFADGFESGDTSLWSLTFP